MPEMDYNLLLKEAMKKQEIKPELEMCRKEVVGYENSSKLPWLASGVALGILTTIAIQQAH